MIRCAAQAAAPPLAAATWVSGKCARPNSAIRRRISRPGSARSPFSLFIYLFIRLCLRTARVQAAAEPIGAHGARDPYGAGKSTRTRHYDVSRRARPWSPNVFFSLLCCPRERQQQARLPADGCAHGRRDQGRLRPGCQARGEAHATFWRSCAQRGGPSQCSGGRIEMRSVRRHRPGIESTSPHRCCDLVTPTESGDNSPHPYRALGGVIALTLVVVVVVKTHRVRGEHTPDNVRTDLLRCAVKEHGALVIHNHVTGRKEGRKYR